MNCPVCKNEEIKDGQNFCQICGFDLKKGPKVLTDEEIEKNRVAAETLTEIVQIQKRITELYKRGNIIAVYEWGAMLEEMVFRATFPEYEEKPHQGNDVKLYAILDGVEFFALSDRP